MTFPWRVALQGVSFVNAIFGGGNSTNTITAGLLIEVNKQLQGINESLLQLNKLMIEASQAIEELPEKFSEHKQRFNAGLVSEEISDIFRSIAPDVGNITNLSDIHADLAKMRGRLSDAFDAMEVILKSSPKNSLAFLNLSYPCIEVISNYLTVVEYSLAPDLLIDFANQKHMQVSEVISFQESDIPMNELVGIYDDIIDFCDNLVLSEGGLWPNYVRYTERELRKYVTPNDLKLHLNDGDLIVDIRVETAVGHVATGRAIGFTPRPKPTAPSFVNKNIQSKTRLIPKKIESRDIIVLHAEIKIDEETIDYGDGYQSRVFHSRKEIATAKRTYKEYHHRAPWTKKRLAGISDHRKFARSAEMYFSDIINRGLDSLKTQDAEFKPFAGKISFQSRVTAVTDHIETLLYMKQVAKTFYALSKDIKIRRREVLHIVSA